MLSAREREILECLALGMTRTQIVERFTLSPHTVRTHIGHVLTKLEVHNTLSAVSIARKAGLAARGPERRRRVVERTSGPPAPLTVRSDGYVSSSRIWRRRSHHLGRFAARRPSLDFRSRHGARH